MSIIKALYTEILWRPLFNGLIAVYNFLPWKDLGLAIIIFTIIIRLILHPLMLKARRAQKDMAVMQPKIKKIQEQYKNNREAQSRALLELYAEHKTNPFSGCLVTLIQLPILFTLFQVFRKGVGMINSADLYTFIHNPHILPPLSFHILDLSRGSIYLGAIAALTQYLQIKLTLGNQSDKPVSMVSKDGQQDFAQMMQWQTLYVLPFVVLISSFSLPSALTLYWTVLNILAILQEVILRDRSPQILKA